MAATPTPTKHDPAAAHTHNNPTLKNPIVTPANTTAGDMFASGVARSEISAAAQRIVMDDIALLKGHMDAMSASHAASNASELNKNIFDADFEIRHIAATVLGRKDEFTADVYRDLTIQMNTLNAQYRQKLQSVGRQAVEIDITPLAAGNVHEPLKNAFQTFIEAQPFGLVGSIEQETRYMKGLFDIMEQEAKRAVTQAFADAQIDINSYAERLARMKILLRTGGPIGAVVQSGDAATAVPVDPLVQSAPTDDHVNPITTAPMMAESEVIQRVVESGALSMKITAQKEKIKAAERASPSVRKGISTTHIISYRDLGNLYEELADAQGRMAALEAKRLEQLNAVTGQPLSKSDIKKRQTDRDTSIKVIDQYKKDASESYDKALRKYVEVKEYMATTDPMTIASETNTPATPEMIQRIKEGTAAQVAELTQKITNATAKKDGLTAPT